METTINWLRQYCKVDADADTIANLLTMSGSEVEEQEDVAATNDTALKLEITSNRTDCYGVIGLARELSALTGKPLTPPEVKLKAGKTKVSDLTSVTIDCEDLCPYYTATVIRGVKVGPSPKWLLDLLTTLAAVKNIRPVNNVVDLTNYVMLEMAQPLHAFDYNKLAGNQIVVRRATKGESMRAINDTLYMFNEVPPAGKRDAATNHDNWYWSDDICAICDAERPQCLGGVMGGLETEITDGTTDVLLESAYFMPMNNRATSRGLGLHSDSSYRFSRGVDPAGVKAAQLRCAQLIAEICGGEIADGVIEAGSIEELGPSEQTVNLQLRAIRRVLGIDVPHERVVEIMRGLGLTVKAGKGKSENINVVVPSARRDLVREIDLIEEVARIHGLDKIPTETVLRVHSAPPKPIERVTDRLADVLVGAGYCQTVTDSFVPEADLWRASPWSEAGGEMVVTNPIVKGQGLLRPAMIQSLLQIRRTNQDRGQVTGIRLFEQAHVYAANAKSKKKNAAPAAEKYSLAFVCDGKNAFAEIKGVIELLAERLQIDILTGPTDYALFEPGHGAEVHARNADGTPGTRLGVFGDIAKSTLDQYELQVACAAAELDVDALVALADFDRRYRDLPRYPGMTRELAIVLPLGALWQDIAATIRARGTDLLTGVEFIGEYRGKQIAKDRKQYNLAMQFQHRERSLTADEINALADTILAEICKAHDAELRQ